MEAEILFLSILKKTFTREIVLKSRQRFSQIRDFSLANFKILLTSQFVKYLGIFYVNDAELTPFSSVIVNSNCSFRLK